MQRGHSNLVSKCAGPDTPAPVVSQQSPSQVHRAEAGALAMVPKANRSKKLKITNQHGNIDEKTAGGTADILEESIHDSQIRNMNQWLSVRNENTKNQGINLLAGQTWNFLTQLGVGGGVDRESMEHRLEEMETRHSSLTWFVTWGNSVINCNRCLGTRLNLRGGALFTVVQWRRWSVVSMVNPAIFLGVLFGRLVG
ncbi:hypothetical protein Ancab_017481 [Ancistrocladus abbreviatus]